MADYETTLTQIRESHPKYADIPDEVILAGLHRTHYADKMPLDEFLNKVGYVQPDLDDDFDMSLEETVKNIPSSAKQMGKDLYQAASHPIDTLSTARNLAQGVVEKALPGEVVTDNTQLADSVGDMYADRYGGWNRIKRTIQNDPVGFAGDVAVVGGGVGTLPKLGKVGKVARTLDPINLATSLSAKALSKLYPKGYPVKLMDEAMKWNTGSDGVSPSSKSAIMLENSLPPTHAGVAKGWDIVFDLNSQIDDILQNAGDQKIPRSRVFRYIKAAKQKALKGGTPAEDLADIQKVVDKLDEVWYDYDMKDFTPADLQSFKKDLYQKTKKAYKDMQAPSSGTESARTSMSKAAREDLEKIDPTIAPINAAEGDLLSILPEMQKKVGRINNRNMISFNMPSSTGVGYLLGDLLGLPKTGAAAGFALSALDTPKPKARIAQGLYDLQNFGTAGDSLTPLMIRNQMLMQEREKRNEKMKGILGMPGSY